MGKRLTGEWRRYYSPTLGWRDLPLFAILENGHIAADHVYFYEFNFKKLANFARVLYLKNHRDLKRIVCVFNLQKPSFYIKEHLSKRKFEYRFLNILFLATKMCSGEKIEFLFILAFQKFKEDSPPGSGSKNVLKTFFCPF